VLLLTLTFNGEPVTGFTPYRRWLPPGEFLQGAAADASRPLDFGRLRRQFNINTVNVYGVSSANVTPLQEAAAAAGMRLVIRLEEYDPATFAFRASDASALVERYADVLARLRPDVVAYVLVNMPVDDPRVHGLARQADYAREAVALVRERAPGVPVWLSLFYGWDGSYDIPSYEPSGADGYALTSYSYPGNRAATAASNTDELIDTKRLHRTADRAIAAHPGRPIVVEYGFQTVQFHGGHWPDQTAGLVADEAAKKKAMQATTAFYRNNYHSVIGTMYFGYDIVKDEGNPPRPVDFTLLPPA
jgi:LmbE family N-acetylglucosaminyl deacetylase